MDKDNLNINLQDWLNDPMLAAQLNRTQSSTPALFNDVDESSNGPINAQQSHYLSNRGARSKSRLQNIDNASTSELSNFLANSRLNLGTLMKFVCIEFFKCNKDELTNLRLIDLTQDSTFPQTLTLRNMQTENSHYKFYNTINRDKSVSNCPVFAVALYSFLTWKHTIISWKNFINLPLIFDSKDIIMLQGTNQIRLPVYTNKMVRSTITPKKELLTYVFPWLAELERDYLTHDRSNYILFSLVELFNYLAKVLLQDFAFLQCTGQLPHLQELIKSELSWQFLESNDWNIFKDEMQRQIDDEVLQMDWFNSVCNKLEDKFLKLSKNLILENNKLSKELVVVKSQLSNMNSMMDQIYHTQRQLLSNQLSLPQSNSPLLSDQNNIVGNSNNTSNNSNPGGILIVDKSNINTNALTNLLNGNINGRLLPNSNHSTYTMNHSNINSEKRQLYSQSMHSLKRVKLDGRGMSNFDNSSRRLSQPQPQPQSPLQIGSPLESLLSKPINSPKITVSMLNNSAASPPPNTLPMSPLTTISSHISDSLSMPNIKKNDEQQNEPSDTNNSMDDAMGNDTNMTSDINGQLVEQTNENENEKLSKATQRTGSKTKKTGKPNLDIKYKLCRDNKTIWDLHKEWYVGLNGKLSIKELIERYGYRRWKVTEDSHFFPTRRIIIDYIETEIDRSLSLKRFDSNDPIRQDREELRKLIVKDLESFREENGLTLNSLSLYFRNLTRWEREICIYNNFNDWSLRIMDEDEKIKFCKRRALSIKDNKDGLNSPEDSE